MARELVPEAGRIGTRCRRTANGLAVERVDLRTLRSCRVEPPNRHAGGYISDGRGNVRIMAIRRSGRYRAARHADQLFVPHRRQPRLAPARQLSIQRAGEGMHPARRRSRRSTRPMCLKKLNGRMALYRVKLDGTLADRARLCQRQVDVDGVVTASRGDQGDRRHLRRRQRRIVYFDADYAAHRAGCSRGRSPNLPLIDFGGDQRRRQSGHGPCRQRHRSGPLLSVQPHDPQPERDHARPAAARGCARSPNVRQRHLSGRRRRPGSRLSHLAAGPRGARPAGGGAAAWRARGARRMGLRLAAQYFANQGYAVLQPNYRGSAGYGDALVAAERLPQLAHRRSATSTPARRWLAAQGIGDPRPHGDRRLVLWRLCGAAVRRRRARPVPGGRRDRAGDRPAAGEGRFPRLYRCAATSPSIIGTRSAHPRKARRCRMSRRSPRRCCSSTATAISTCRSSISRRMDSALRGAGKTERAGHLPGARARSRGQRRRGRRCCTRIGAFLRPTGAPALRPKKKAAPREGSRPFRWPGGPNGQRE